MLFDGERRLELAGEIGRGGEGAVFAVQGDEALAVKLYTAQPDQERIDKLTAMVDLLHRAPELADQCAWPQRLVRDAQGQLRGFVMARLTGQHPIHELYSPEQRKQTFPMATWRTLVEVAADWARIVAVLHAHGVVVGDVNERNLLLDHRGRPWLVDADSFQIIKGERIFLTGVGVADYTPPELQGERFSQVVRSANHDRFGLAVLLFKLVFLGRHPFSGGPSGDLGAAIASGNFDYPQLAQRLPHLLPLQAVPASIQALFAQAFDPQSAEAGRPSPEQWLHQLRAFADHLEPCAIEPAHAVLKGAQRCPWCLIEATLHYAYFARAGHERYVSTWTPRDDQCELLRHAMGATEPPPDPTYYHEPAELVPVLALARRVLGHDPPAHVGSYYVRVLGGLGVLAGAAGTVVGPSMPPKLLLGLGLAGWSVGIAWDRLHLRAWRQRIAQLGQRSEDASHRGDLWRAEAYQHRARDRQIVEAFDRLAAQHQSVLEHRQGEIARLERDAADPALIDALAKVPLQQVEPAGLINAERKKTLLIRHIQTAADIERDSLVGLPGLTLEVIDGLVRWRQALEVRYGGRRKPPPKVDQYVAIDVNCGVLQEALEEQMADLIRERQASSEYARQMLDQQYRRGLEALAELEVQAAAMWRELRGEA